MGLNPTVEFTMNSLIGGAACVGTALLFNQKDKFASLALTQSKLFFIGAVFTACNQYHLDGINKLIQEVATSGALAVLVKGFDARPIDLLTTSVAIFAVNYISSRLYDASTLKNFLFEETGTLRSRYQRTLY